MGNWRNPPPRRIFRRQRASWSSTEPPPPEWQDGIPLWEKKFCILVGSVPWGKIVDAKKVFDCHKSVLSWNDSAGEEAFQNAKKRFWAKINGLQCDISPPNPDIYIDDIDWNPKIDPELIKELDQDRFVPFEGERNMEVGHKNKRTRNSRSVPSEEHPINHEDNNENPWERNIKQDSVGLKNKTRGWHQREDYKKCSGNLNNDENPWECGLTQCDGGMMDNRWGHSQDNSWGWNKVGNRAHQSWNWDTVDNPWEHGCQGAVLVKDKGGSDLRNRAWGWNQLEPKNLDNSNSTWKSRFNLNSGALQGKGWRAMDWNPKIDPEGRPINHEDNNDNPWERNIKQDSGGLKNKTRGWNQREDYKKCSGNSNNDENPWECGLTQCDGGMMDNRWGHSQDNSWGWNKVGNPVNRSRNWDTVDNPWEHGCEGVILVKDKGGSDLRNRVWGWNQQEPKNLDNSNSTWKSRFNLNSGALQGKGWRAMDWNPKIDPEGRPINHEDNNDKPWELNIKQDSGGLKNKTRGWNQREDYKKCSGNSNNDENPWECGLTQCDGGMMDNRWGHSQDNSWGWNKVGNPVNQSRNWDTVDNPWEHGCEGVILVKDKGGSDLRNRAWGWNQQEPKNLDNSNSTWKSRFNLNSGALQGKGWRESGKDPWGCKQWENNSNELKRREFRRTGEGWGTWN